MDTEFATGDRDINIKTLFSIELASKGTDAIATVRRPTSRLEKPIRRRDEPAPMALDLVVTPGHAVALEFDIGSVGDVEGGSGDVHVNSDCRERRNGDVFRHRPALAVL